MILKKDEKQDGVASGFFWRFSERIGAQVVSFVVSLILARLLSPEHYGAIAIVNIFISLANVLVSSGFGNSLIQKKNADELDFSTVFYINLVLSLVIYTVVFFTAPLISDLYKIEVLSPALRVMGLSLFISALNNVQEAYVSKNMIFKKFFFATIGGTIISAIVGIAMAYADFGIWALVAQYMTNKLAASVVLFLTIHWRPRLQFSLTRLKGLFSYSWKLLVSELINTGYLELRSMVIGIKYTSSDLAYYNKGQSFPKLLSVNINSSLQSVLFPKMSNAQDNKEEVKNVTRKAIRVSSFVIAPLIIGLALVAKPFINLLLTEKWLPCVPFLQAYCIFYLFMPIQSACLQVIKSLGRSDIYLKLEILKKVVGIVVLIATMPFGTFAIAAGAVGSNVFAALVNVIPTKKLLSYSYKEQFADYFHGVIPLAVMSVVCIAVGCIPMPDLASVSLQVVLGAATYVILSYLLKLEAFMYLWNMVLRVLKRKKTH